MSGWSESEESKFEVTQTDFKITEYRAEETTQLVPEGVIASQSNRENSYNYFLDCLGFQVGKYFEGEKRIYHSRK